MNNHEIYELNLRYVKTNCVPIFCLHSVSNVYERLINLLKVNQTTKKFLVFDFNFSSDKFEQTFETTYDYSTNLSECTNVPKKLFDLNIIDASQLGVDSVPCKDNGNILYVPVHSKSFETELDSILALEYAMTKPGGMQAESPDRLSGRFLAMFLASAQRAQADAVFVVTDGTYRELNYVLAMSSASYIITDNTHFISTGFENWKKRWQSRDFVNHSVLFAVKQTVPEMIEFSDKLDYLFTRLGIDPATPCRNIFKFF